MPNSLLSAVAGGTSMTRRPSLPRFVLAVGLTLAGISAANAQPHSFRPLDVQVDDGYAGTPVDDLPTPFSHGGTCVRTRRRAPASVEPDLSPRTKANSRPRLASEAVMIPIRGESCCAKRFCIIAAMIGRDGVGARLATAAAGDTFSKVGWLRTPRLKAV